MNVLVYPAVDCHRPLCIELRLIMSCLLYDPQLAWYCIQMLPVPLALLSGTRTENLPVGKFHTSVN